MSSGYPESAKSTQQQALSPSKFRWLKKSLAIILMFLGLTVLIGFYQIQKLSGPVSPGEGKEVVISIPARATTNQIAGLLAEEGVIQNELLFELYTRLYGFDRHLQAGEFRLNTSMPMVEVVNKLVSGQVISYTFTIPEGFTVEQIAARLAADGYVDKDRFLSLVEKGNFNFLWLDELPAGPYRLEGFLFPDTYRIPKDFSEQEIIQMMLDRFTEVYDQDYRDQAAQMGLSTLEAITLASIVEREVRKPEELEIVSAVFHNRLKKGMRLESCATIQYLLGEPKEVLLNEDLEIDSPYNTYKNAGLPPGPIASPGKAAIHAALNPADVDYLYFVAKNDGSHYFSRTLAEHNRAKKKYLATN